MRIIQRRHLTRTRKKLTLIVEGTEDMKRNEAKAGIVFALTTLAATRREAIENMISLGNIK